MVEVPTYAGLVESRCIRVRKAPIKELFRLVNLMKSCLQTGRVSEVVYIFANKF